MTTKDYFSLKSAQNQKTELSEWTQNVKINMKIKNVCFFLLVCNHAIAQFKIDGNVCNQDNKVIDYAEVSLLNNASEMLQSALVNEQGYFNLTAPSGEYTLQISQLGSIVYKEKYQLVNNISIGKLYIKEVPKILAEVVITSKKQLVERKIDRIVFNVANSVSASGKDVYSALMVTPGVRVTENSIVIIGKNKVAVMIDDQMVNFSGEDLTNFLKSIPADDIAKIEIITTPPSKYEAEGNSGILNIRYKKGRKNTWSSTIRSSYTQATYASCSFGGSFNYQKDKWSIVSNLYSNQGSKLITDTNILTYPDQIWSANEPRKVTYDPLASFRTGIDYKLNDKVSFGVLYLAGYNKLNIKNNRNVTDVNYLESAKQDYAIISSSKSIDKTPSHSLNLHSDIAIDTIGKKISLNLDYFNYQNNIDRLFDYGNYINGSLINNTYTLSKNIGNQDVNNYSFKADVEHPMKWASLSYGVKVSFVETGNDIVYYNLTTGLPIIDLNQSNQFRYDENTQALYGSINKEISKKWTLQFGLRFENTQTKGFSASLNQENTNNYFKIFPTLYLVYKPNDESNYSFNYSRRIDRPSFEYLNPFVITQNDYSYVEGNPFLRPSYSDNIEVGWFKNQKWINTVYFSKIKDGFQQIAIIDPVTNIQQVKPLNYFDTYKIGLNESYTLSPFKFWESINALDVNYSKTNSLVTFTDPSLSGFNSNISTTNTLILNAEKTALIGLNYWYNFSGVYDIYKMSASSSLDLSLSFLFLDKALSINLYGNDILSGQRTTLESYSNNTRVEFRNYYDTRNFRISVSYKFGNKKVNVNQREFGNEAEKNRVEN